MTLDIITLVFSLIAIILSVYSWHKSRVIYDIEKYKFPKNVGDSKSEEDLRHEKELKEKLKSGKWQIAHIYERNSNELMVVVGKVKK